MAHAQWDEVCKIEKGVPMPPPRKGGGGMSHGPKVNIREIAQAEIGDSMLIRSPLSHWQVRMRLSYYCKTYGYGFHVRQTGKGIRVWRVR